METEVKNLLESVSEGGPSEYLFIHKKYVDALKKAVESREEENKFLVYIKTNTGQEKIVQVSGNIQEILVQNE